MFKITKPKETFLFFLAIGLLISMLGFFILPERFFYDTQIIVKDLYKERGLIGSYPFTIWFYHITGLSTVHFSIIGLLQYSIFFYLLSKIGLPKDFHLINAKNILTYLSLMMVSIFLCMPSKEFISVIYFSLIVYVLQKVKKFKIKIFLTMLMIFFFGYFFREYFILIGVLTLTLFFVSKIRLENKKLAVFLYGISIAIMMSLSYGFVKGEFMSQHTREYINKIREGGKATNTIIVSPLDTEKWYGETVGIVYGFFSVNIPLNGLKYIFSPQIVLFIIWQLLLFYILLMRYDKVLKVGIKDNTALWAFNILFSYFICQGVFEPDLGSAVRHKMGVFPLIYFVLYYDSFKKEIR